MVHHHCMMQPFKKIIYIHDGLLLLLLQLNIKQKIIIKKKKIFPIVQSHAKHNLVCTLASPLEVMHPYVSVITIIASLKFLAYLMMLCADFDDVVVLDGVLFLTRILPHTLISLHPDAPCVFIINLYYYNWFGINYYHSFYGAFSFVDTDTEFFDLGGADNFYDDCTGGFLHAGWWVVGFLSSFSLD